MSVPLDLWLAFVVASTIILVIPGPTIIAVIGHSLREGRRAHLPLVAGVALGDATAVALALTGLGALLATSAMAFQMVKIVGALYLIWLGLKLIRSRWGIRAEGEPDTIRSNRSSGDRRIPRKRLLLDAYFITTFNPKGWLFFLAFLPQFVDSSQPLVGQLWLLGSTFVLLGELNAWLYARFATAARDSVLTSHATNILQRSAGGLLIGAGILTLFSSRHA